MKYICSDPDPRLDFSTTTKKCYVKKVQKRIDPDQNAYPDPRNLNMRIRIRNPIHSNSKDQIEIEIGIVKGDT